MALATSSMSARSDRPELLRRIVDLQGGEAVIAEKMDRISRLLLADVAQLVKAICNQGARRATLGVVDLSEVTALAEGVARIVLESAQEMLLRLALQMAVADDEGRRNANANGKGIELAKAAGRYGGCRPNRALHARVVALRAGAASRKPLV